MKKEEQLEMFSDERQKTCCALATETLRAQRDDWRRKYYIRQSMLDLAEARLNKALRKLGEIP